MPRLPTLALAFVAGTAIAGVSTSGCAAPAAADLTGLWSNASLTWLERDASQSRLALSPQDARTAAVENPALRRAAADAQPTDPQAGVPDGPLVAANQFWADQGSTYALAAS